MPDTAFATLLDKAQTAAGEKHLRVPDDWMQGRTAYGGLVAAMALKSMRGYVARERKVRSLFFSFVGPLDSGPFFIQTQLLRSGKSVTTIESKLIQNDKICCTALGSFGGDRESMIQIEPIKRLEMPDPSKALELPYIEGLTPAFTRHFNYRWCSSCSPVMLYQRPLKSLLVLKEKSWRLVSSPTSCLLTTEFMRRLLKYLRVR